MTSHHPVRCYVSQPVGHSEYAILYIADGFGCDFINTHLVADAFARAGYLVAVPDIFDNDAVPKTILTEGMGSFDFPSWIRRHPPERIDEICAATLKGMQTEHGIKKIGGAGYCFGGRFVMRFLAAGKGLEAGFVAHPSLVEAEEVEGIAGPLSIACAEKDDIMPTELRRQSEDILIKKSPLPYQVCLYSGVEHGFAVRTDLSKRVCRFAKESAFFQAVRWFDEWLKKEE